MPRVNRFTVVFPAGNRTLTAKFSHMHAEKGFMTQVKGIDTKVLHRTTCTLTASDVPGVSVNGLAYCSIHDKYDWRRGVKTSFLRALEKTKLNSVETGAAINSFFNEMKIKATDTGTPTAPAGTAPATVVSVGELVMMDPGKPVIKNAAGAYVN